MKFFNLTDDLENDLIAMKIYDYQSEFNEGNYEFSQKPGFWTVDDELKFIDKL